MRFAYADPPYLGQAKRHYGAEAKEVNHPLLIAHLNEFDAWALSLSSPSLRIILPLCPDDVRVGAWVKPFASWKTNPAYAWEPVIFRGGRPLPKGRNVKALTVRDYVSANITTQRNTHGAKPAAFCHWLFDFLGAQAGDDFTDVFPGSGAVARAWKEWSWHRGAA